MTMEKIHFEDMLLVRSDVANLSLQDGILEVFYKVFTIQAESKGYTVLSDKEILSVIPSDENEKMIQEIDLLKYEGFKLRVEIVFREKIYSYKYDDEVYENLIEKLKEWSKLFASWNYPEPGHIKEMFLTNWYITENLQASKGVQTKWQLEIVESFLEECLDDWKLYLATLFTYAFSEDNDRKIAEGLIDWVKVRNLDFLNSAKRDSYVDRYKKGVVSKHTALLIDFHIDQNQYIDLLATGKAGVTEKYFKLDFADRHKLNTQILGIEPQFEAVTSVSYKWLGSDKELIALYDALRVGHITDTEFEDFEAAFSNQLIGSFRPIRWVSDNASELIYFITSISKISKSGRDNNNWIRLSNCFVKSDGSQFNRKNFKSLLQALDRDLSPQKRISIDRILQPFK